MGVTVRRAAAPGRIIAAILLGLFVGAAQPAATSGARSDAGARVSEDGRGRGEARRHGARLKKRRKALRQPRAAPAATPRFEVILEPGMPRVGDVVVAAVRLTGAAGPGRHAAFHAGADPAFLRYLGPRATGRGALLVEEAPGNPGEIVVYRSSLPEGFAPVETLVEIEFEAVAPGTSSVALSDVRLMDGRARDLAFEYESAGVEIR